MTDDLVKRFNRSADAAEHGYLDSDQVATNLREAAAEIERLQAEITALRTSDDMYYIRKWRAAESERDALRKDAQLILEWQEQGERLAESRRCGAAFRLGEWWADRPWRKRDAAIDAARGKR